MGDMERLLSYSQPTGEIIVPAGEPIFEIKRRHLGNWLLIRVTAFDDRHKPSFGLLVAHSSSHAKIYKKLGELPMPSSEEPLGEPYYVTRSPGRAGLLGQLADNIKFLRWG